MNVKKHIEKIKSALIAVLLITALLLGAETGLFTQALSSFGISTGGSADGGSGGFSAEGPLRQAARPLAISINLAGSDGGVSRFGVKYSQNDVDALYERVSATLGEALGSSGEPGLISRKQWEHALGRNGVYFDYLHAQPLSALAQWLGSEILGGASEHLARRLLLAQDGSSLSLYYLNAADGEYYRCGTALDSQSIAVSISGVQSNGSFFAFESGTDYTGLEPDTLFTGLIPELYVLSVRSPIAWGSVSGEELLECFNMNRLVARAYEAEADGAVVYVEGDATLRVSPGGALVFSSSSGGIELGSPLTLAGAINGALAIVQSVNGRFSGSGDIFLSGTETTENGYKISFCRTINGLYVSGGTVAEITITNGSITRAELLLREYSRTDTPGRPYPELQAAAIVQAGGGGEPVLCYMESGSEAGAEWIEWRYG